MYYVWKRTYFNFSRCDQECLENTYSKKVRIRIHTFPKTFSQGQLPKWQLPKCAISQAATSQRLNCTFRKLPHRKIIMGSCHMEKFLWESTLGNYFIFVYLRIFLTFICGFSIKGNEQYNLVFNKRKWTIQSCFQYKKTKISSLLLLR